MVLSLTIPASVYEGVSLCRRVSARTARERAERAGQRGQRGQREECVDEELANVQREPFCLLVFPRSTLDFRLLNPLTAMRHCVPKMINYHPPGQRAHSLAQARTRTLYCSGYVGWTVAHTP
jgi:hypothetical protein